MQMHFNIQVTADAVAGIIGSHFTPLPPSSDEEELDTCHYSYFDSPQKGVFRLYFNHGASAVLKEGSPGAWDYDGPASWFPGYLFEGTTDAVVFSGEVLDRHHVEYLCLNSADLLARVYTVMEVIPSLQELYGSNEEKKLRRDGENLFASVLHALQEAERVNDHLQKLGARTSGSFCRVGATKGMVSYLPHLHLTVSIAGRQLKTTFPVTEVVAHSVFEKEVKPWLDSIASVVDKTM